MKKKDLMASGGVLMVFMFAAKGIGALYRIPLTNIVGAEGMGLYQMIYPLYALLLTVASGGLPTAISKIVAVKNDEKASYKVLKVAAVTLATIGGVTAVAVVGLRGVIATLQGNPKASLAYAGIAPAIFFVCLISCFRGYFQGRKNMIPGGISQIVEQVVKLVAGLTLSSALMKKGVEYGVLGALLGVSVSELFALTFLLVCYGFSKKSYLRRTRISLAAAAEAGEFVLPRPIAEQRGSELMREIFRIAVPVTLSSLVLPLTQVIDSVLIVNLLSVNMEVGRATELFGLINGPVASLINMPTVLTMSIGVSLLPKIASATTNEKYAQGQTAFKICLLVALPCSLAFMIFPKEILGILYSRGLSEEQIDIGSSLLKIGGVSVTYIAVIQVATSCLQGVDKAHLPAISLTVGAVVKIMLTLALLRFFSVMGAMIASVSCYAVTAVMDLIYLKKHFVIRGKTKVLMCVPFALTVMLVAKFFMMGVSFAYSDIVFIASALGVYVVGIFALRLVNFKELFV